MSLQNAGEIKERIILILKQRGPNLPVPIAKEVGMSILFTSAFLSELISDKRIKITRMKVGSSPIYFIPGQEMQLERFSKFLKSKEKEAYELLKEKKYLKDNEQNPAIRVALREIRDFAFPFKKDNEIYWRYITESEEGFKEKSIEKKVETIVQELKPEIHKEKMNEEKLNLEKKSITPEENLTKTREKPLIVLRERPKEKKREKSDFILRALEFLKAKDIEMLQELESKKREFEAITRINSDLGKIEFFTIVKDKKSITENDLRLATQKSQSNKRPILLVSTGDIQKKAMEYFNKYENMIKFLKINL